LKCTFSVTEEISVGVYGATGYAGTELIRLIDTHPNFVLSFAQSSSAHARLGSLNPLLRKSGDVMLEREPRLNGVEAVFLSLPAGESMKIVPELLGGGRRVIDLGPDYRLKSAGLFESYYSLKHLDEGNLCQSIYGLTEVNRELVTEAMLVSNPGCYPTAALLPLYPVRDILSDPIIIDAKSGTSGAGKEPSPFTHHSEVAENIRPYHPNSHRHIPEICDMLGIGKEKLIFVPHLVPIVRGIEESIYLPGVEAGEVRERIEQQYSGSPFVSVVKNASLNLVLGTNHCLIEVTDAGSASLIFSYIDNLLKGAGGQAIQNANIMFGLQETAGLVHPQVGVGV